MKESDPDLDLVRDLDASDPAKRRQALGQLYDRHHRRVFAVAWRVLGDWSRAQDVTQEVFLHLADRIVTFRGDADLVSWIYRVTVNRAIDMRRRERRRPAWSMGDTAQETANPLTRDVQGADGVADRLDREVVALRVREALAQLSPKLRAILVLRYLEGLSYEDLAQVLDCSIGTVKSRLNRAHAAMKRRMRGQAGAGEGAGPLS